MVPIAAVKAGFGVLAGSGEQTAVPPATSGGIDIDREIGEARLSN
jgi:hypothetical protein